MKAKLERRFLAKLEKVNHISDNKHYVGYSKLYENNIFIKVFKDENKFILENEDKYHRALCYVYADGKSVQKQLLEQGLAEIKYVKEPDTRYLVEYQRAQNSAKANKKNLWS